MLKQFLRKAFYCFLLVFIVYHTTNAQLSKNVLVPTAFTPNANGGNSTFVFFFDGYQEAHFIIYDRWGRLVFEQVYENLPGNKGLVAGGIQTSDESKFDCEIWWCGTDKNNSPCPEGLYVYSLKVKDNKGKETVIPGTITLIR